MTDREKIRAEIERLKKLSKKNCIESGWDGYDAQVWVLENVLSFIDSLSEETNQTTSPDEAIKILDEKIALRKKNGSWKEGMDVYEYAALRIDIAKRMLPITSNWHITNGKSEALMTKHGAVVTAFDYADEFIKQLKKRNDNHTKTSNA